MDDIYVRKVKEGDVEAFRYFIRTYQHMAFSVAISVVKDAFLAEEVVQEAFMNAFQKIASFKGQSKFSTWLYRIIVNLAFRKLNKEKKWQIDSMDVVEEVEPTSALDQLQDDERKHYINEALKVMPSNESLALRLFYLEELSMEELIGVTGWSLSNVKVTLHRARKRFYAVINTLLENEVKMII